MNTIDLKQQYLLHSLFRIFSVGGIFFISNIVLLSFSYRLDLTQEKLYTLSESTKNIVKNLHEPVTFKLYFSNPEELPRSLIGVRQEVFYLAEEYKKIGGKNIIIEKINPGNDEKLSEEANRFGIPVVQFNTLGKKELEIKSGFSGVVILYKEDFVSIPFISALENLEFEITSAMNKLTREKNPIIGVLKDHGGGLAPQVLEGLRKQYSVREISIMEEEFIPDDIDALIVSGANETFLEREKYILDQFVMRGGKFLVFFNGTRINKEYLTASLNDMSLNSLLGSYGIRVNGDVVLDMLSHQILSFQSGNFSLPIEYPAYPKAAKRGINRSELITKNIPSLTFPFPSSLAIDNSKISKQTHISELVKTSEKSFAIDGNGAFLGPKQLASYTPEELKPQLLAAMVSGFMKSAFEGEKIPLKKNKKKEEKKFFASTQTGQILVVGSGRFLESDAIKQWPENFVFLVNSLDYMVQGKELIDIRSRSLAHRPLLAIDDKTSQMIRYGNIFASAILSFFVGGIFFIKRKREGARAKIFYS